MQNYNSDNISSLSAGDHIRLRPKMYFEKCFNENSLNSFVFEFLCHAFDEYFDGNCSEIEIKLKENQFTISYNAGMSLEKAYENISKAECIMTKIAA